VDSQGEKNSGRFFPVLESVRVSANFRKGALSLKDEGGGFFLKLFSDSFFLKKKNGDQGELCSIFSTFS